MIGRFVDDVFEAVVIRAGVLFRRLDGVRRSLRSPLQALDVHCRSFLAMNHWPDDLHGAQLRGANVQAAQRSGLQASDSTETTNASPVRDTTSPTAADGVAGEDAPQNQPHVEDVVFARSTFLTETDPICHYCFGPRDECRHGYREHFVPLGEIPPIDPMLLAQHETYSDIQDEFFRNQK